MNRRCLCNIVTSLFALIVVTRASFTQAQKLPLGSMWADHGQTKLEFSCRAMPAADAAKEPTILCNFFSFSFKKPTSSAEDIKQAFAQAWRQKKNLQQKKIWAQETCQKLPKEYALNYGGADKTPNYLGKHLATLQEICRQKPILVESIKDLAVELSIVRLTHECQVTMSQEDKVFTQVSVDTWQHTTHHPCYGATQTLFKKSGAPHNTWVLDISQTPVDPASLRDAIENKLCPPGDRARQAAPTIQTYRPSHHSAIDRLGCYDLY